MPNSISAIVLVLCLAVAAALVLGIPPLVRKRRNDRFAAWAANLGMHTRP